MDEENQNPKNLPHLFSSISRLYNSSISVFTAILFGWIAFIGFILNQNNWLQPQQLSMFLNSGLLVFFTSALYFYIRILRLGRFIAQIENDLGLRDYINELPRLSIRGYALFTWIEGAAGRPNDMPERWSLVEIVASIVLFLFFVVTTYMLISIVSG